MSEADDIRMYARTVAYEYPFTADALREVADTIDAEARDVDARLAKAGAAAAEAQKLAEELTAKLAASEKHAATAAHFKRVANEAVRLSGNVVAELFRERQASKTAQRTIAVLLDALGETGAGVEVAVSASDEPGALDPKYLTDILCALAGIDPRPDAEIEG